MKDIDIPWDMYPDIVKRRYPFYGECLKDHPSGNVGYAYEFASSSVMPNTAGSAAVETLVLSAGLVTLFTILLYFVNRTGE